MQNRPSLYTETTVYVRQCDITKKAGRELLALAFLVCVAAVKNKNKIPSEALSRIAIDGFIPSATDFAREKRQGNCSQQK